MDAGAQIRENDTKFRDPGIKIRDHDTGKGSFQIRVADRKAEIVGYRGKDIELAVPREVDGNPVVRIGKKAFLSNKMIEQITLPETVEGIDDWAFAYCSRLNRVILPYHRMEIGQGIFKECPALEQIAEEHAGEGGQKAVDTAWLLAAVMNRLDAFYLFDLENAGAADWIAKWDSRMLSVMEKEDSDGFSKMLLCGEEDYGSRENDLDYYMEQRRREKVRIAMLRLMHDYRLDDRVRDSLKAYLLEHIKGKPNEETWKVILEEYGDDLKYYRFLTELGGVNAENFQPMMEDMGELHTEMKAYLMKYHAEQESHNDAFAVFEL